MVHFSLLYFRVLTILRYTKIDKSEVIELNWLLLLFFFFLFFCQKWSLRDIGSIEHEFNTFISLCERTVLFIWCDQFIHHFPNGRFRGCQTLSFAEKRVLATRFFVPFVFNGLASINWLQKTYSIRHQLRLVTKIQISNVIRLKRCNFMKINK